MVDESDREEDEVAFAKSRIEYTWDVIYPKLKKKYENGTLYKEHVYTAKIPKWEDGKYEGDVDIEMHKLELDPVVERYLISLNDDIANNPAVTYLPHKIELWTYYKLKFSKIFPVYALSEKVTDSFIKHTYEIEAGGRWEMINGKNTLVGINDDSVLPELNQVMINIIAGFQLGFPYKPPEGTVQGVPKGWIMDYTRISGDDINVVYINQKAVINHYKPDSKQFDKFINNLNSLVNLFILNTMHISHISIIMS